MAGTEQVTVNGSQSDHRVYLFGGCEPALRQLLAAGRYEALLAQPHRLALQHLAEAVEHCCTASIGVALFGPADEDPVAVLQRADRAMYRAKDRSHGRASPV